MAPTRTVKPPPPAAAPRGASDPPAFRVGPLVRAEAWWWTGPLGHLAAGASDLVPLFARWWLYLGRQRVKRRVAALRGRR